MFMVVLLTLRRLRGKQDGNAAVEHLESLHFSGSDCYTRAILAPHLRSGKHGLTQELFGGLLEELAGLPAL